MSDHPWYLQCEMWDHWDATAEDTILVVSMRQAGTASGPTSPVIEVEVVEAQRWVIVTLYSRQWRNVGTKLAGVNSAIGVQLLEPLGTRKVCDGAGGERRSRIAIPEDDRAAGRHHMIRSARRTPWAGPLRHFSQSQADIRPELVFQRSAAVPAPAAGADEDPPGP